MSDKASKSRLPGDPAAKISVDAAHEPSPDVLDVPTARGRQQQRTRGPRVVPALTIAAHPDATRVGAQLVLDSLSQGTVIEVSRKEPDFTIPGQKLGVPLGDPFISRRPVRMASVLDGGVRLHLDSAGTDLVIDWSAEAGRAERAGQPTSSAPHSIVDIPRAAIAQGVSITLAERVVLVLHLVDLDVPATRQSFDMIGESTGLRRVRNAIAHIRDLDVPVLIRGQTGTGKELVARALHEHGPRRDGPFVSVNLGAVPRELAAAELFGARKGAFTGASKDRLGFFRAAADGTLFLDEVGEASAEVQVMLLRVLETGEMYPVGTSTPVTTNARLIAATDANLESQIADGSFKAPLLHRLAGYQISIPALCQRREDIGMLFFHFARQQLEELGQADRLTPTDPYADPWMPAEVANALVSYSWPGNIRQLRNTARQLVIEHRDQAHLQLASLGPELRTHLGATRSASSAPRAHRTQATDESNESRPVRTNRRKPMDIGETELVAALRASAWDFKGAADRLGISRSSIYDLVKRCPSVRTAGDLEVAEIARCHELCAGDLDAMAEQLQVSRRALGRRVKELGLAGK